VCPGNTFVSFSSPGVYAWDEGRCLLFLCHARLRASWSAAMQEARGTGLTMSSFRCHLPRRGTPGLEKKHSGIILGRPLRRVLSIVLLFLAGCGGSLDSSISGLVTVDGEPLRTGRVIFYPVAEGPTAYGTIDNNGLYCIRTGQLNGVMSGEYVVSVVATETPPGPIGSSYGKLISPIQYTSQETTDLKFTIQPGSNRIDLPLRSESK
jgi:hypothetical protein